MIQQSAPMRRNRRPVPGAASFDKTNPIIYLGTVAGAKKARARTGTLIAPLDIDPELLSWPVLGLSILLVTEPEYAVQSARLAGVLCREGAELVVVVDGTRNACRIHRAIGSTALAAARPRANVDSAPDFD